MLWPSIQPGGDTKLDQKPCHRWRGILSPAWPVRLLENWKRLKSASCTWLSNHCEVLSPGILAKNADSWAARNLVTGQEQQVTRPTCHLSWGIVPSGFTSKPEWSIIALDVLVRWLGSLGWTVENIFEKCFRESTRFSMWVPVQQKSGASQWLR